MRIILAIFAAGLASAADPVTLKRDPPAPEKKVEAPAWPLPAVKLPDSAHQAAEISSTWSDSIPVEGKEGRVLFVFGAGLPVVTCAPLRVCALELEPGEKPTGEPAIGDGVRWVVTPQISGSAPKETWLIMLKPKSAGLDTNLVIATDRRTYFLRLVSDPVKYVARVAFDYPENPSEKWKAAVAQQKDNAEAKRVEATIAAPIEGDVSRAFFGYDIKAKKGVSESIKPVRVYDVDGKTFVVMPPSMRDREAPILLIQSGSKNEQVNFMLVKGDTYRVDRLFDRAVLVLGVGKNQSRVEIVRTQKGA